MTVFVPREYHRMDRPFLDKRMIVLVVVSIAAAVLLAACSDDAEEKAPEDVATQFLDHLRRGERDAALDQVWPETRRELDAAVEVLDGYTGGTPPIAASDLLVVTRLESSFLFASINIGGDVPQEPTHAESVALTIEYRDGRSADIAVRWSDEEERWYVDLPFENRRSLNVLQASPEDDEGQAEEELSDGEGSTQLKDDDGEWMDSTDEEMSDDE